MSEYQTQVVHVVVKIDSKKGQATATKAIEIIDGALANMYGGEGWHPWHTVSRHGGPRETIQSISVEGAVEIKDPPTLSLDERLAQLRQTIIDLEVEAFEADHIVAEGLLGEARARVARARRSLRGEAV